MSFESEIYEIMTSDALLNSLAASGGIHYQNLPKNWLGGDSANEWIVYEVRKSEQEDCINSKNVFMTYQLSAVVIQRNINTLVDTISNRMINYLNNLESGNIYDIGFVSDQPSFNQQQNTYTNALEFVCIYVES